MNKKFYTYEKILLGLRDEYLKNQELLRNLKECIYIGDPEHKVESFCIKAKFREQLNFEQIGKSKDNVVRLMLQITQRLSTIQQAVIKINSLMSIDEKTENTLMYDLIKENDSYSFVKNNKERQVTIDPEIGICEKNGDMEFAYLIEQILNSEFMNSCEKIDNRLFCGAMLNITAHQIYLGEYCQNIIYDPSDDILQVYGFDDTKQVSEFMNYQIH